MDGRKRLFIVAFFVIMVLGIAYISVSFTNFQYSKTIQNLAETNNRIGFIAIEKQAQLESVKTILCTDKAGYFSSQSSGFLKNDIQIHNLTITHSFVCCSQEIDGLYKKAVLFGPTEIYQFVSNVTQEDIMNNMEFNPTKIRYADFCNDSIFVGNK